MLRQVTPTHQWAAEMTWTAQVRHVFLRNLADTWISLAVAVALVAVVAALAVRGQVDDIWSGILLDYAVRLAILIHLALVVQCDPPPYAGSFWATQPREPSAVVTAKFVHALMVLGVLIAAWLVVQSAWHFSGAVGWDAFRAQLRYAAVLVIPVMAMASLFPAKPRAAFGAAFFCLTYGNVAETASRSGVSSMSPLMHGIDILPPWIWVPVIASLCALIVWRYGRVELPPRMELSMMALSIFPFALLLGGKGAPRLRVDDLGAAPSLSLSLETRGDYLSFELQAPRGLPGDAYRLVDWVVIATRRDGSLVRLKGSDDIIRRNVGRRGIVHLAGDSLRIIGGDFLSMHDSASFHDIVGSFGLFDDTNLDDVVSARLEGVIESYRMEQVDRFPLRNGLVLLRDGRRAELTMLRADTAGPGLLLRTKWLGGTGVERAAWPVATGMRASELSFALANPARGSMLPLRVVDSEYFGMGATQLGFGVRAYDYTLRPAIWTIPIPAVDSAWLASADVVVGSPVLTGAIRIRVDGVASAPSSRRAYRSR